MAAFVGKHVVKHLVAGKKGSKHQNPEDAYFEKLPANKSGGRPKKDLPAGLTADEARILAKVKRRAYRLDMAFNIPYLGRFGWSSVLGLIPGFGDVFDLLLAYMLVKTCCSVKPGLPQHAKNAMYWNLVVDFVIGIVPFLGDIADAVYKCNTKNFVLLEKELDERAKQRRRDAGIAPNSATGLESAQNHEASGGHETDAPSAPPPRYTSTKKPRRPEQVYDPERSEGRSGYFGGRREVDLEAGEGVPAQQPPRHQSTRSQR